MAYILSVPFLIKELGWIEFEKLNGMTNFDKIYSISLFVLEAENSFVEV